MEQHQSREYKEDNQLLCNTCQAITLEDLISPEGFQAALSTQYLRHNCKLCSLVRFYIGQHYRGRAFTILQNIRLHWVPVNDQGNLTITVIAENGQWYSGKCGYFQVRVPIGMCTPKALKWKS